MYIDRTPGTLRDETSYKKSLSVYLQDSVSVDAASVWHSGSVWVPDFKSRASPPEVGLGLSLEGETGHHVPRPRETSEQREQGTVFIEKLVVRCGQWG